jgi:hypothetical protein
MLPPDVTAHQRATTIRVASALLPLYRMRPAALPAPSSQQQQQHLLPVLP